MRVSNRQVFDLCPASLGSALLFASVLIAQADEPIRPNSDKPPSELAQFFVPPEQYRSDFGHFPSPLVFADGTRVRNRADWQRRRAEILSTWDRIMGPWPPLIEKPRVQVLNTTRRANITQQQLRIEIALGKEMVDALLVFPDGEPPAHKRPAVL